VCGTPIAELLIASHIVPWSDDETIRLNPTNGLCLCALHDRGFDRGLMTISPDYDVIISSKIRQFLPQEALEYGFMIYENHQIILPKKLAQR
jgi:predicted restriction endonuclease